jgi:hypothetical protein
MRAHKRIGRTCEYCGAPFRARLADVKRGAGRYHTRRCRSLAGWRDGRRGVKPSTAPRKPITRTPSNPA